MNLTGVGYPSIKILHPMCQDKNMNVLYNGTEEGLSHTWKALRSLRTDRKKEFLQQAWRSECASEEHLERQNNMWEGHMDACKN